MDDKRDYGIDQVGEDKLIGSPLGKGNRSLIIKNQGRTNRCTAYALSYVIEAMLAAHAIKNKKGWTRPYVDEELMWDNQIKRRAFKDSRSYADTKKSMERGGDYLHNAMGAVIENGVYFYRHLGGVKKKYHVTFKGYARADKRDGKKLSPLDTFENIKKLNDAGHPTYTGSHLGEPWYDIAVWNVVPRGRGGHAYSQTDATENNLFGPNSWGDKWGDKGYWYVHGSKSRELFGPYYLFGMRVKEV